MIQKQPLLNCRYSDEILISAKPAKTKNDLFYFELVSVLRDAPQEGSEK